MLPLHQRLNVASLGKCCSAHKFDVAAFSLANDSRPAKCWKCRIMVFPGFAGDPNSMFAKRPHIFCDAMANSLVRLTFAKTDICNSNHAFSLGAKVCSRDWAVAKLSRAPCRQKIEISGFFVTSLAASTNLPDASSSEAVPQAGSSSAYVLVKTENDSFWPSMKQFQSPS